MPGPMPMPPDPSTGAGAGAAPPSQPARWQLLVLALLLPPLLTVLLHFLAVAPGARPMPDLLVIDRGLWVEDASLQPPVAVDGRAVEVRLPLYRAVDAAPAAPVWLLCRFELSRAADATWVLALSHRTPVLVYLNGRLLANSVPLPDADLPPRNLQIGDRPLAVRVGIGSAAGVSLSRARLGPAEAVEAADRPRRFWAALRTGTSLSALLIGTLLLFTWMVERRERLYVWSALHLLMLALLLAPYALEQPLLPAPWWRMALDAADVLAKGLAPLVIASWAGVGLGWVRRLSLGYLAVALPFDVAAAYVNLPWTDFAQPWPWWALGSRFAMLALAAGVALHALARLGDAQRLALALLAGTALWIWVDVSLFALVLPGVVRVVDLNVVAYAGWTMWVALLLHRRLVGERRLRDELAAQLDARTDELKVQFAALQSAERERTAASERERLLQEMHDGLGSALMTAKMRAASEDLSSAQMVELLDACLREMRLAVDTLSVTDGDLGVLLGNLRHRLGPGLAGAGLELKWAVGYTPLVPALQSTGGRELIRILQEVLANVMHHAGASTVTLNTARVPAGTPDGADWVRLNVRDDGRGMPDQPSLGRGVRGIRRRAAALGARADWQSPTDGPGTVFVLDLPLAPVAGVAAAGSPQRDGPPRG
jgi:signal transduction histidine kinase